MMLGSRDKDFDTIELREELHREKNPSLRRTINVSAQGKKIENSGLANSILCESGWKQDEIQYNIFECRSNFEVVYKRRRMSTKLITMCNIMSVTFLDRIL